MESQKQTADMRGGPEQVAAGEMGVRSYCLVGAISVLRDQGILGRGGWRWRLSDSAAAPHTTHVRTHVWCRPSPVPFLQLKMVWT